MHARSLQSSVSFRALLAAGVILSAPAAGIAAPKELIIHSFTGGGDGSAPVGPVSAIDVDGALYGTTSQGGDLSKCGGKGCGVVFELTPPSDGTQVWMETVLHQFTGGFDGAAPAEGLLIDRTGALYGTTSEGGGGDCHSYQWISSVSPMGVSHWRKGAPVGCGTIFKLIPPAEGATVWTETILHRFQGPDGRIPSGISLIDKTGALYGVTTEGGMGLKGEKGSCGYFGSLPSLDFPTGCGTVFKLTPPASGRNAWTLVRLHAFDGLHDGGFPVRRVIFSPDGSLLGATAGFFANAEMYYSDALGTVFELTPPTSGTAWREVVLHTFGSGDDGIFPGGGLYLDSSGAVLGTTVAGGEYPTGIAFALTPPGKPNAWTESILHEFAGGSDGANPAAGLTRDRTTGVFYGTTRAGGDRCTTAGGCGTVYALAPPATGTGSWTETVLHRFGRAGDGAEPQAPLTTDQAGNLYGTTAAGGAYGDGTVFMIPR